MYKSPIEVYYNEVYQKFNENFDNACVNAVIQAGFHVDKEELTRALAYDRGAYEAGYTDGQADGRKERDAEIVRCKDCKHRPTKPDDYNPITMDGFVLEFPDEKCPCQCSDGWYSKYPDDDWYCPNGERKGGDA